MRTRDISSIRIVFITAPKGEGEKIAKKLLEEKIAACTNITSIKSMYWWKDKIETDEEDLIIIKTRKECIEKLMKVIKEVHPYEVPEILSIIPSEGNSEYLSWVSSVTKCG